MEAVVEVRIRAQRSQKSVLEGVLGGIAPEQPRQVAEDLVAVRLVEPLEGGNDHRGHHRL